MRGKLTTVLCAVCQQPITPFMSRAYRMVGGISRAVHRACEEKK